MTGSRSVAIVSGKGGSGKTMIATEIGRIFADVGSTILIDGDTATAGLSYFLVLKYVRNIQRGYSTYALSDDPPPLTDLLLDLPAPHPWPWRFLPIGDHRRLALRFLGTESTHLREFLGPVIARATDEAEYVVVDCRGGIDDESVAVCAVVDDIILVVEADATSFQASSHVVDVLTAQGLAHKLRGFIINKAIEDPTAVARNGPVTFGTQYLSAVPFDLEASRAFLISELTDRYSIFAIHVREALSKAYPELIRPSQARIWTREDYSDLNVLTPESARGGVLLGGAMATAGVTCAVGLATGTLPSTLPWLIGLIAVLTVIGIAGTIEPLRRIFGRMVRLLYRGFRRKGV
ncbi:ParA family protein [Acrocarpospora catenulata]|uniref:ParA family protein n=1 Tax=Acrocarpospora catenulata TaxID=2836182 RepID=UPI001BDAFCC2|nr:ParA family protein [Acrocarpospora catenulata]